MMISRVVWLDSNARGSGGRRVAGAGGGMLNYLTITLERLWAPAHRPPATDFSPYCGQISAWGTHRNPFNTTRPATTRPFREPPCPISDTC